MMRRKTAVLSVLAGVLCFGSVVLAGPQVSDVGVLVSDANLVSWWKFDEGSGAIAYDSAGSNDGNVYGATWTTGQIDGALVFDGNDDYVGLGTPASLDNLPVDDVSITAWIYDEYSSGSTWGTVAGCYYYYRGWCLRTYSNASGDRSLHFQVPHSPIWSECRSADGTISTNTWHHVAAVWYAGTKTAKLYIDGTETAYQKTISGAGTYLSDGSREKEIGSIPVSGGNAGHFFKGTIDEVRIYDRALSAGDIQKFYQDGL